MDDVLNILFNPLPNAIMTVLTGISLLYWLFTMLMGDGIDFGNADFDFDGGDLQDVDASHDVDSSTDHDTPEPSFFSKAMEFINIGKAPMMVIVTLFKFIGWIITIASSLLFELGKYGAKSVLILLPVLILTYFLMHYVTIPVVKLYQKVGYMGEEAIDFLGRTGLMKSTIQGDSLGSVEIRIKEDLIRLNVKSINGDKINYGDEVIVLNEEKNKKYYLVQRDINLNNLHN